MSSGKSFSASGCWVLMLLGLMLMLMWAHRGLPVHQGHALSIYSHNLQERTLEDKWGQRHREVQELGLGHTASKRQRNNSNPGDPPPEWALSTTGPRGISERGLSSISLRKICFSNLCQTSNPFLWRPALRWRLLSSIFKLQLPGSS